jgi:hypothetical protein
MKTFNVLQFYNGFCYYFKSTCSSFKKVVKLFTLSCLQPLHDNWIEYFVVWIQICMVIYICSEMHKTLQLELVA